MATAQKNIYIYLQEKKGLKYKKENTFKIRFPLQRKNFLPLSVKILKAKALFFTRQKAKVTSGNIYICRLGILYMASSCDE